MKIRAQQKGVASNCVGRSTPGIPKDSSQAMTQKQAFPYRESGMARRKMLALLAVGGASIIGGVSLVNLNINLFSGSKQKDTDPLGRMAQLTFPPPKSKVPRTVFLRGHIRNVDRTEDLRVEVLNAAGQYVYKKMRFGAGDEIFRDDHHFGLVGKDIGKKYWVQLVIPEKGIELSEDIYNEPQPVLRLGKQTYYIRRAGPPTEKLSPDTWRQEMAQKGEIA